MKKAIIFLVSLFLVFAAYANQPYSAVKGSKITVSGTSTMHDWTMSSEDISVQAKLAPAEGNKFEMLSFSVPVNSLKSGKSGMDDNAYKALNEKKYPRISFELASAKPAGSSEVSAVGNLTIAGVTKEIKTTGKVETLSNGDLKVTGTYTLNMSEYKVEPPSFMFGTVTTGDEVTISYELILSN